jgi:hypothetical protein
MEKLIFFSSAKDTYQLAKPTKQEYNLCVLKVDAEIFQAAIEEAAALKVGRGIIVYGYSLKGAKLFTKLMVGTAKNTLVETFKKTKDFRLEDYLSEEELANFDVDLLGTPPDSPCFIEITNDNLASTIEVLFEETSFRMEICRWKNDYELEEREPFVAITVEDTIFVDDKRPPTTLTNQGIFSYPTGLEDRTKDGWKLGIRL